MPIPRPDNSLITRSFRRWLRAMGWNAATLAERLGKPMWRAEQLHCGRFAPTLLEIVRLGPFGESFMRTLAIDAADVDMP